MMEFKINMPDIKEVLEMKDGLVSHEAALWMVARIEELEAAVAALTPGPYDIMVTVPELDEDGMCNKKCKLYDYETSSKCGLSLYVDCPGRENKKPSPGCPRYQAPKEG